MIQGLEQREINPPTLDRRKFFRQDGTIVKETVAVSGILPGSRIIQLIQENRLGIDPFIEQNVQGHGIDFILGKHYWREANSVERRLNNLHDSDQSLYEGPFKAVTAKEFLEELWRRDPEKNEVKLVNTSINDLVIVLAPGESILSHTEEFFAFPNDIAATIHARSSLARIGITICRDASLINAGYCGRITLEISNNYQNHFQILRPGARVGQMVFHQIEPGEKGYQGKYQNSRDLQEQRRTWDPNQMLPKGYQDTGTDVVNTRITREGEVIETHGLIPIEEDSLTPKIKRFGSTPSAGDFFETSRLIYLESLVSTTGLEESQIESLRGTITTSKNFEDLIAELS